MQCKEIQEMLSAYIDQALDEQEMLAVENHVCACSHCYQELTALQETVKLLKALGEVTPPQEFRSQLLLKLRDQSARAPEEKHGTGAPKLNIMRRWFDGINKYLVAALIMIGLGMGTGIYQLGTLSGSPQNALESSRARTLEIARSTPGEASGDVTAAQEKSQQKAAGGAVGSESRAEQAPPEVLAKKSVSSQIQNDSGADRLITNNAAKGIAAPGSVESTAQTPARTTVQAPAQTTADNAASSQALNRTAASPTEKYSAFLPAQGTADNPAGNPEQSPAGSAERTPAVSGRGNIQGSSVAEPEAPKLKFDTIVGDAGYLKNSTVQHGPEIAAESQADAKEPSSGAKKFSAAASESSSTEGAKASGEVAGWIFPGVMLAGGIVCAGYYIRLRSKRT